MLRYILARLGQAVLVLWAAFTVGFFILYALPGDTVSLLAGGDSADITPAQLDALRAEYGLDKPLIVQYLVQLGRFVTGDFGRSAVSGRSVLETITQALPQTAQIAGLGLLFAVVIGSGVALLATYVRQRWLQQLLLSLPPLGVAIPSFWFGLLLLQVFSFGLQLYPAFGNTGFESIVLPAITLALPTSAMIAQLLAKSLRATLAEPYIDTAKAKGASRIRVQLRHALRNAALPALTMAGLVTGQLLAGSVVTETVFSRDGIGRVTSVAVSTRDIPMVLGLVVLGAVLFVVISLIVDLLYPLLDPRIVTRKRTDRPSGTDSTNNDRNTGRLSGQSVSGAEHVVAQKLGAGA